jgi:hypothetical protein
VAVFFFVEWERALQVSVESEPGVGDDSIRTLSERRQDAQKRRLRRMKERIVRAGGESGDSFQNLVALSGKSGGDVGG